MILQALGSTQLAFKDNHYGKTYGTWEKMVEEDYIQQGYTRENIIDNYTLVVFSATESSLDEEGNSNSDSTFTIVAVPLN